MQSVLDAMFSAVACRILSGNVPHCLMILQMNNLHYYDECLNFLVHEILLHINHQGPISSTSLRRVFVLKTSYEVRTLKIGFHQTIELCELLTFCRIFKTNI